MKKNNYIKSAIIQKYYESVTLHTVNLQIQEACREVAAKVADKIVSEYKLKDLIIKQVTVEGLNRKKLIVAVELERVEENPYGEGGKEK